MGQRRLAVIAATAVVGLVAGCSSAAGPQPPPTPEKTGPAVPPTCKTAPAALLNSVLGVNVGEPDEQTLDTVVVCRYPLRSGISNVLVRFQLGESAAMFRAGRDGFDSNGQPTKDVSGVGDEAYSSTIGQGDLTSNTLVARSGPVEILITSPATIDAEKLLAQQLITAIG
jgi:hypothetical protein